MLTCAADNGTLFMWDWRSGHNFQRAQAPVQPGSIDSEGGVFALSFDRSGSRLLTAEADKTIKMYREDPNAVCANSFARYEYLYCTVLHCSCVLHCTVLVVHPVGAQTEETHPLNWKPALAKKARY